MDPGLASHAGLLLQRIDYDESPTSQWMALWESTHSPPNTHQKTDLDWRSTSEWHNLRALLARRRMQHIEDQRPGSLLNASGPRGEVMSLHETALRHLQAALYMALWSRDWDRVQAYVANLAFHFQTCLKLRTDLGVAPVQVLQWHRLTMAYEDKLGAGRDSAWEYIFFAEFWQSHEALLHPDLLPDPISHNLGGSGPDEAAFYERAVVRLRECGDDRQVAIGHSLFLGFAQMHLSGERRATVISEQSVLLTDLLSRQSSHHLIQSLTAEGYVNCWPQDLKKRLAR